MNLILEEDEYNRENMTIGDCLEYVLKKGILLEIVAYGKSDMPQGLFVIVLKFLTFLLFDIQSTNIINYQEVHHAIM